MNEIRLGLAERDPTADVEGYDAMAKAMILAGLVFGTQLRPADVVRHGITGVDGAQIEAARSQQAHLRQVVTVGYPDGATTGNRRAGRARAPVPRRSPRARHGSHQRRDLPDPAGRRGDRHRSWAGPEPAGQVVLSDLIAVARMIQARRAVGR
jgi:Homoserine dehydrogenase